MPTIILAPKVEKVDDGYLVTFFEGTDTEVKIHFTNELIVNITFPEDDSNPTWVTMPQNNVVSIQAF